MSAATIKARRITGGAIVTITRSDGRIHRHKVGLRRYNRLRDTLACHLSIGGNKFMRNGFEGHFLVAGLADSRRWVARFRFPRPRHWRPQFGEQLSLLDLSRKTNDESEQ